MPYNGKGKFQNRVRIKSQSKEQAERISAFAFPKSPHYRVEMEPFVGMCINVEGTLCDVETGRKYKRLLLQNIKIQKVPSKAREYIPETETDHIYVALSNDFIPPKQGVKLWARGFVYEYLSRGKKNIGIQVLTLMEVKEEMP